MWFRRSLNGVNKSGWVSFKRYCGSNIKENEFLAIKSCKTLRHSRFPEYVSSPFSKLHNAIWREPLENVYVVKKPWNEDVTGAMIAMIRKLHDDYPAVNIIVTDDVADELLEETSLKGVETIYNKPEKESILTDKNTMNSGSNPQDSATSFSSFTSTTSDVIRGGRITLFTGLIEDIVEKTDLIITLGGDGTILRAVSAFLNSSVPPVLSFALGTLGFLLPFDFSTASETFRMVYESRGKALHRTRLECYVVRKLDYVEPEYLIKARQQQQERSKQVQHLTMVHAMNDIALHRGSQPNLTALDIYIDGSLLTSTNADGLVFLSPTGSTAYLLSAGGSIVHPLVRCILATPICPRSLSFRPLILPSTSHIMIKMLERGRNTCVKLSIDGIAQPDLNVGDEMHIVSESGTIYLPGAQPELAAKRHGNHEDGKSISDNKKNINEGIWCLARSETDWTNDINELLGFNLSFGQKK